MYTRMFVQAKSLKTSSVTQMAEARLAVLMKLMSGVEFHNQKFRVVPPRSEVRSLREFADAAHSVTEILMYRDRGSNESNEWFAFRVRPRHEKQVSIALREKGLRNCPFRSPSGNGRIAPK